MSVQANPSRAVFVRNLQSLVEIILTDHAYTKPWSAHPEASKARPMKTLFMPKDEEDHEGDKNVEIDVCDVEPSMSLNIIYDTTKAKTVMSECEKHVTTVTSKRTPDTWEELICRTGWGSKQNLLFDKVIKVLSTLRLARLAYEQTSNEPVKRRIATDKATKRFRQILSAIEWDIKLTTWLHTTLIDGLSIPLLACYLDVLQTLRAKAPTLVDKIVSNHSSTRRGPAANAEALALLLKRPWDPSHGLVTEHKTRKLPCSPLLLIVPSGPTTNTGSGTSSKRTRFWQSQLSVLGKVVPVTMHTSNGGSGVTIGQCLDHIIGAVRTKVLELRSHFPNRPIILIGWSIGALVSCQVALMESVCAVVCLGFPLAGIDGVRGDVEDPLLELRTPVLFVIGSHSNLNSQEDIEEMREKLKTETSLLVVGGADEQLRLLRAKKKQEGLTQSMVDRLIMDQIGEFLGNVLTSSNNNMQQRNDLSDADETDIKKKKRKRSLTTDNSGTHLKSTKGVPQSPRKAQKVALSEGTKNVIKIPVGGALGALSGVRNLSQPSPAKKPRTSKSKSSKVNAQVAVGALKTASGSEATARPAMQSVAISNTTTTPQPTPGFISLAAKGTTNVLKPSVTQSYLTVSGSPSIMKQSTGAVQYIIKPQSQRQLPVQTGAVTLTSSSVTQSTGASGVRYTSLSPSPTSPFTSVLNLKGNATSQGVLGASSASNIPRTAVSTATVRTVLGQPTDALKRTISGKPVVAGQVLPSQQISMSTASLSSSQHTSHVTTAVSGNAVQAKGSTAGSHIQGSTTGQVSKSLQMNSQRSLGQHSQVRYIVGPTSSANHPGTVLVTTQGGVIRAVSNTAQGLTSSPQLSTVKSYSPSGITQGAQQRSSPAISVSGTSRPQSAPAKAPGTITYVLTTTAGAAARSASPQTSVNSKTQVLKPGSTTSVTHVLTTSPNPTPASTKSQTTTFPQGIPTGSVMLKGGTVVSMQSLLARLPHGTKVITSNSADGNSNVYVVGNVLTQVQNSPNRPKQDATGVAQKATSSVTSTGQVVKSTTAARGAVVTMSVPTTAVQSVVSNQGPGTIRVLNTTQGTQFVTQGGKLVTQAVQKQQNLTQGAQKVNLAQQLLQQKTQIAQQSTSLIAQQQTKPQTTQQSQLQTIQVDKRTTQAPQVTDPAGQQKTTKTSETKPS